MWSWIKTSAPSRFAGVMMAVWLCGMGPAWAGGGGSDGGASQPFLDAVCEVVGVPAGSCPQLPTLTQIILGMSGYQNTPPDFVRGPLGIFAIASGTGTPLCSVSGNFGQLCTTFNAISTVNQRAPSSITLTDLPNLTPLAFQASVPPQSARPVTPVALGTQGANSFLYPVLTGPKGQHKLDVVLDYPASTSTSFVKNQQVGSFTFPMVILNSDNTTETPITAALSLTATCSGSVNAAPGCLAGTVTGIPGSGTNPPPTLTAAQLGIKFGLQLAPSPNSSTPHWIFTFELPVIVTKLSDPVYFGCVLDSTSIPPQCNSPFTYTFVNQFSGQPTAFSDDDLGFTPTSVGRPIGVSPYPAPLCPASGCPQAPTYGFCATIAGTPAAATFASIGTEGTVYASSPVGQPQPLCP